MCSLLLCIVIAGSTTKKAHARDRGKQQTVFPTHSTVQYSTVQQPPNNWIQRDYDRPFDEGKKKEDFRTVSIV